MPPNRRRLRPALRRLAFVTLAVCATAKAAEPLPVEAFGLVPSVSSVQISPDGKHLAWANNAAAEPHAVLVDLETGQTRRVGAAEERLKLRDVVWADNQTVLIEVSQTESVTFNKTHHWEKWRTMAVDADGGAARMLLMQGREQQFVSGAQVLALNTETPKQVLMSTLDANGMNGWVWSTFNVDLTTGKGRMLEHGSEFTDEWIVDPGANVIARGESGPDEHEYRVQVRDGSRWRDIHEFHDEEAPDLMGLSRDGKSIVALGFLGGKQVKAWLLPLDGSAPTVLRGSDSESVEAILFEPRTHIPAGVRFGGPLQRIEWFDPEMQRINASLARAFAGRTATLVSSAANGRRLIVRTESPTTPPVYYLVDLDQHKADIVGESYPLVNGRALGDVRVFEYTSRDGVPLVAYLTLPSGAGESGLKLVVLPHGGPESRDSYGFDWLAQFLASRGYAVVQPQYRGSTGFGDEHRRAGYKQWGKRMQDDVTDAVSALIAKGTVDPSHVAIVGASYGGYAALAGAAFTPELYACAASIGGISDLPLMIGQVRVQRGDDSGALEYWHEHIGSQYESSVIDASPARAADRITAPVLLIHGKDDTVVPVQQSRVMAKAMQTAGKQVTLVELDGEDHWLSLSDTRIRTLRELDGFLAKNL